MGLHDVNSHANVLLCTSVCGILLGPLFHRVRDHVMLRAHGMSSDNSLAESSFSAWQDTANVISP